MQGCGLRAPPTPALSLRSLMPRNPEFPGPDVLLHGAFISPSVLESLPPLCPLLGVGTGLGRRKRTGRIAEGRAGHGRECLPLAVNGRGCPGLLAPGGLPGWLAQRSGLRDTAWGGQVHTTEAGPGWPLGPGAALSQLGFGQGVGSGGTLAVQVAWLSCCAGSTETSWGP